MIWMKTRAKKRNFFARAFHVGNISSVLECLKRLSPGFVLAAWLILPIGNNFATRTISDGLCSAGLK